MKDSKPWQPEPLAKLQVGFALVAIMALVMWFTQGGTGGTQMRLFRVGVTFVGVGGLIVSTLLRLAKKG
ncbi:MAG TPA: hypothetical protein VG326_02790 [Tepidisphaeraceae bacterium]|nr:hypothetical protein [Tepidisphaeraceae bacterium]